MAEKFTIILVGQSGSFKYYGCTDYKRDEREAGPVTSFKVDGRKVTTNIKEAIIIEEI